MVQKEVSSSTFLARFERKKLELVEEEHKEKEEAIRKWKEEETLRAEEFTARKQLVNQIAISLQIEEKLSDIVENVWQMGKIFFRKSRGKI